MSYRLIRLIFPLFGGLRYWMRPCREPKGSGIVRTRTKVSDNQLPEELKQMDMARYRRFSGALRRHGPKGSFRIMGSPSLPRSRWVTGAGPTTPPVTEGKQGRASKLSSLALEMTFQEAWKAISTLAHTTRQGNRTNFLTVTSNG